MLSFPMNAFIGESKSIRRVSRTVHVCELFKKLHSYSTPRRTNVKRSSLLRPKTNARRRSGVDQKLQYAHHPDWRSRSRTKRSASRRVRCRSSDVVAENRERAPRAAIHRKANHDSTRRTHASIMGPSTFRDKLETPSRQDNEVDAGKLLINNEFSLVTSTPHPSHRAVGVCDKHVRLESGECLAALDHPTGASLQPVRSSLKAGPATSARSPREPRTTRKRRWRRSRAARRAVRTSPPTPPRCLRAGSVRPAQTPHPRYRSGRVKDRRPPKPGCSEPGRRAATLLRADPGPLQQDRKLSSLKSLGRDECAQRTDRDEGELARSSACPLDPRCKTCGKRSTTRGVIRPRTASITSPLASAQITAVRAAGSTAARPPPTARVPATPARQASIRRASSAFGWRRRRLRRGAIPRTGPKGSPGPLRTPAGPPEPRYHWISSERRAHERRERNLQRWLPSKACVELASQVAQVARSPRSSAAPRTPAPGFHDCTATGRSDQQSEQRRPGQSDGELSEAGEPRSRSTRSVMLRSCRSPMFQSAVMKETGLQLIHKISKQSPDWRRSGDWPPAVGGERRSRSTSPATWVRFADGTTLARRLDRAASPAAGSTESWT